MGSICTQGNELILYAIISSLWTKQKPNVVFCHLTYNTHTSHLKKFKGKCGTECLNTRFSRSILLYAEYSVKLFLPNSECMLSGTTQCHFASTPEQSNGHINLNFYFISSSRDPTQQPTSHVYSNTVFKKSHDIIF